MIILYLYYGGTLQEPKIELIDTTKHFIIEGRHPSPLSARYNKKGSDLSFFGHNYFNKCNDYLKSKNKDEIIWDKKIDLIKYLIYLIHII